jgi:hypothetical protein
LRAAACLRHSYRRLPGWLVPLEGRSLAVARAGYPVLLWLVGRSSNGRYITGAFPIAIGVPFDVLFIINMLLRSWILFFWILEVKRRKLFKKV